MADEVELDIIGCCLPAPAELVDAHADDERVAAAWEALLA